MCSMSARVPSSAAAHSATAAATSPGSFQQRTSSVASEESPYLTEFHHQTSHMVALLPSQQLHQQHQRHHQQHSNSSSSSKFNRLSCFSLKSCLALPIQSNSSSRLPRVSQRQSMSNALRFYEQCVKMCGQRSCSCDSNKQRG